MVNYFFIIRFEKRIYIFLFEVFVRIEMFKIYLGNIFYLIIEEEFWEFGKRMDGYFGVDI